MKIIKKSYLFLLLILVCVVLIPAGYSMYQEQIDVGVVTTTGNLICDVVVDTNENYIENNEAYFYVNVNNYKIEGNNTILTSTDIDYDLIIQNKDGSNGLFRYVDEDGNTNETATSIVNITDQYLGKTKATRRYKVYVTTDANIKSNVDFKVKLDAKQKKMD